MKTTRYIIQYHHSDGSWKDAAQPTRTEPEALALLPEEQKTFPSLTYRVIRRDTVTTEEVISPAPATAESAT